MNTTSCSSCQTLNGKYHCSQCKVTQYCSKECQVVHWKIHKKECKKIAKKKDENGEKYLLTGKEVNNLINKNECHPDETEKFVDLMDRLPLPPNLRLLLDIPKFHQEYKRAFPSEKSHHAALKYVYNEQKLWEISAKSLNGYEWNEGVYLKRYGEISSNLFEFLGSNPKPGDIFHASYPSSYPKERYQTMKNVPIPKFTFERGKTYVFIGYVDLHNLIMGKTVGDSGKIKFVGLEMSEICVARSLILNEMIKIGIDELSILQVWFSTGLSEKSMSDLKQACQKLLNDDVIENSDVKDLIKHWMTASINLSEAKCKWAESSVDGSIFLPSGNLCNEQDRVDYCRYCFTGQIFQETLTKQTQGNVTMFSMTDKFKHYVKCDENVFATLSLNFFKYDGNLMRSYENHIRSNLSKCMQWVKDGLVECEFHVMSVTPANKEGLTKIKSLNPYLIDWSNIPDYISKNEFFKMAKACSSKETVHSVHFMNWSKFVYGTFILEYEQNATKVHTEMKPFFEFEFKYSHSLNFIPFFWKNKYFVHPFNLSSDVLARAKRDVFLSYYFDVKGFQMNRAGDVSYEFLANFFQRTGQTFNSAFSFNMDINLTNSI